MNRSIFAGALVLGLAGGMAALVASPLLAGASAQIDAAQPSAAQRVATLSLVNVGCVTCAPIVKRALSSLPGVASVSVNEGFGASAQARVIYDPRKISPATLAAAATNAGYPASIVNN